MTRRRDWRYGVAPGQQVGLMICTACRTKIETGEFRYRETEEAYLPQHKQCSLGDPEWVKMEQRQREYAAFYEERKAALQVYINKYGAPDDDLIDQCMAQRPSRSPGANGEVER